MLRAARLLLTRGGEACALRFLLAAPPIFRKRGGYIVPKEFRPDRDGAHRGAFEAAKKKIYATQTHCAICGREVDFRLKYPHPLSPSIDHIIPVSRGGHPSDIANLQLAHWTCNRQKSDKLLMEVGGSSGPSTNRDLPHACDWAAYRG